MNEIVALSFGAQQTFDCPCRVVFRKVSTFLHDASSILEIISAVDLSGEAL